MKARDEILAAIRRNRPVAMAEAPDIPVFTDGPGLDLVSRFTDSLLRMGGKLIMPGPAHEPWQPARDMIARASVICSMVPELRGNRTLAGADHASLHPASLHDVDLAVLRARFGVAETGSVALLAEDLGVNAVGYLAQRLLILLDPASIVENLHHAYERPEFEQGHYLVLQTGPSATADIEGVLIHGAQGVRALTVLLMPVLPGQADALQAAGAPS